VCDPLIIMPTRK